MKNTKIVYLILGLGIGIVLSNILHSTFPDIEYIDVSDKDIIKRAEELGYVSIKEKISIGEDENNPNDKDKIKENKEKTEESSIEEFIQLDIVEGDTLKDITKKLLEFGLIENEEKFILTVEEKDMDKRFAYGTFKVPINANYNQIIELLTK